MEWILPSLLQKSCFAEGLEGKEWHFVFSKWPVSVEPVPQRLQLMDMFMNVAWSQSAFFNVLSRASPSNLCGLGTVPGPAFLCATQTSQTPNAPQSLCVTSTTNTSHARALVCFNSPNAFEISPRVVWILYTDLTNLIQKKMAQLFFPSLLSGKKSWWDCPLFWAKWASKCTCWVWNAKIFVCLRTCVFQTQVNQPWMSPNHHQTATLVIEDPQGKNSWLNSSSAWDELIKALH